MYVLLVINFFREVKRAIFVAQADRAAEQDAHAFVRIEQQPERPPANLTFNGIQALVRSLLMHMQGDCDVGRLSKCSVRRSIMALAEVINSVTTGTKSLAGA